MHNQHDVSVIIWSCTVDMPYLSSLIWPCTVTMPYLSSLIWSCTINMPYLSSFDHAQSTCCICHLIMHSQRATVSSSWGDRVRLIEHWIQLLTKGDAGVSCWNLSSVSVLFVLPAVIWRLRVLHWMVGWGQGNWLGLMPFSLSVSWYCGLVIRR